MRKDVMLGIDAGGTHTDAVLVAIVEGKACIEGQAKVETRHDDLPLSVREVLKALEGNMGRGGAARIAAAGSVTLGTTLAVNALVQGRADRVGLVLSAGPGLAPERAALGDHVCVVPGGLDHRGVEVVPLDVRRLEADMRRWPGEGVAAVACVGKFSPRNPVHEQEMGRAAQKATALPVTLGHRLSGRLNFPRRVATAYYNAAVERLHNRFLDAVEEAVAENGIHAPIRLLKADGGAVPAALSRREPVQSILSGPAASVMGVMALCPEAEGCSALLDVGGTTTDIALFVDGSPVIDREGMRLGDRRTLVRSLASVSIGVGGDSLVTVRNESGKLLISVGPLREGPAMAFGGSRPTLLDCLNVLDAVAAPDERGDIASSRSGVGNLAAAHNLTAEALARQAAADALGQIRAALDDLLARINSRPIYTLAQLRSMRGLSPKRVWLVGGPAGCLRRRLEENLGLPVHIPAHAAVANAVGAALTLPTAGLEIYADTGSEMLRAPALDLEESIGRSFTLDAAKRRAREILGEYLAASGVENARVEVVEADLFATLDDRGYSSRDIRVTSQATPGIAGRV